MGTLDSELSLLIDRSPSKAVLGQEVNAVVEIKNPNPPIPQKLRLKWEEKRAKMTLLYFSLTHTRRVPANMYPAYIPKYWSRLNNELTVVKFLNPFPKLLNLASVIKNF